MITVTRGNPTDEELAALVMALLTGQTAVVSAHTRPQAWLASAGGYRKAPTAWGLAARPTAWGLAAREWRSWS